MIKASISMKSWKDMTKDFLWDVKFIPNPMEVSIPRADMRITIAGAMLSNYNRKQQQKDPFYKMPAWTPDLGIPLTRKFNRKPEDIPQIKEKIMREVEKQFKKHTTS